jgi:hypothetical protein
MNERGPSSLIRSQLRDLLSAPSADDIRDGVRRLVEANRHLRELGTLTLPGGGEVSARRRILRYLQLHTGLVVDGEELMVVAGISEYARRIRELRVQEGWPILSGVTARDMRAELADELPLSELPPEMRPDQYLLQEDRQDVEAATRWRTANEIRRSRAGVQTKILRFFRENVGQRITSEELRYVAGDRSEWARRTRELRTEEGWPIVTKFTGDPTLPMGVYVLARDEQSPPHDRHIPEIVRREVMARDDWRCRWSDCGWSPSQNYRDPRFLEVHHVIQHAHGGTNEAENLVTLCNLHHDEVHRSGRLEVERP